MTGANRHRFWFGIAGMAFCAILCGLTFWVLQAAFGIKIYGNELDVQLARAKELGVVLEAKDIIRTLPKGAEDATPEIQNIFQEMAKKRIRVNALRNKFEQDWKLSNREVSQHFSDAALLEYAAVLPAAEKVVKKKFYAPTRDWEMAAWVPLPEFTFMMRLTELFSYRASKRFQKGEWALGMSDLITIIAWREYALQEPVFPSILVGGIIDSNFLRSVESGIELAKADPIKLRELEALLDDSRFDPDILFCSRGIVLVAASVARNIQPMQQLRLLFQSDRNFQSRRRPRNPVRQGIPGTVLGRNILAGFLKFYCDEIEFMKSHKDQNEVLGHWDQSIQAISKENSINGDFINSIEFSLEGTKRVFLNSSALRSSGKGLIRLLLFKMKHDRFPNTISELGELGKDPFTGNELHSNVKGDRVAVYSLGNNKADDHGDWSLGPRKVKELRSELDIGMAIPARPLEGIK